MPVVSQTPTNKFVRPRGVCAVVICMLQPVVERESPVVFMTEVMVTAGQPETVDVGGPGADMLQSCLLHLGQRVGTLEILLKDKLGAPYLPLYWLTGADT